MNDNLKSRANQWFSSDIISCVNCLELFKHLPRPHSVTINVKVKVQPCTGLDKPCTELHEVEAASGLFRRPAHSAARRTKPMIPEWAIGTSHGKTHIFKTGVRKVQNSGGSEGDKK